MEEIQLYKDAACTKPIVPVTGMATPFDEGIDVWIGMDLNISDFYVWDYSENVFNLVQTAVTYEPALYNPIFIKWCFCDEGDTSQYYSGSSPLIYLDEMGMCMFEVSFYYTSTCDFDDLWTYQHFFVAIDDSFHWYIANTGQGYYTSGWTQIG